MGKTAIDEDHPQFGGIYVGNSQYKLQTCQTLAEQALISHATDCKGRF